MPPKKKKGKKKKEIVIIEDEKMLRVMDQASQSLAFIKATKIIIFIMKSILHFHCIMIFLLRMLLPIEIIVLIYLCILPGHIYCLLY